MWLVAGLGNPGRRYAATRHNVGYRVVEVLAERRGLRWRGGGLLASGPCRWAAAADLVLAQPTTYMNRSGEAAAWLLERHDASADRLLVVVDDLDLPLGRLRLRASGGPGTHNGLRDIVGRVGRGFPRLRLGVRGEGEWDDLAEHVLSPFAADEEPLVRAMVERAADAVEAVLADGLERASEVYNRPPEAPAG